MNQVHRWLVDALGDDALATALSSDGWLSGPEWGAAVERARLGRYPRLPLAEGAHRIGLDLGRAFLHTEVGALLGETLSLLTVERAMETLVPAISSRLFRQFEVNFVGGVLQIRGRRMTPAQTTQGFLEAMLERVAGARGVRLTRVTDDVMEFELNP